MKSWLEREVEARERGYFSDQDRIDIRNFATCVVGEYHQMYPEIVKYASRAPVPQDYQFPVDDVLYELGIKICDARESIERFAELRQAIEDRVMELKREHIA